MPLSYSIQWQNTLDSCWIRCQMMIGTVGIGMKPTVFNDGITFVSFVVFTNVFYHAKDISEGDDYIHFDVSHFVWTLEWVRSRYMIAKLMYGCWICMYLHNLVGHVYIRCTFYVSFNRPFAKKK
eukprot:459079_1